MASSGLLHEKRSLGKNRLLFHGFKSEPAKPLGYTRLAEHPTRYCQCTYLGLATTTYVVVVPLNSSWYQVLPDW